MFYFWHLLGTGILAALIYRFALERKPTPIWSLVICGVIGAVIRAFLFIATLAFTGRAI